MSGDLGDDGEKISMVTTSNGLIKNEDNKDGVDCKFGDEGWNWNYSQKLV